MFDMRCTVMMRAVTKEPRKNDLKRVCKCSSKSALGCAPFPPLPATQAGIAHKLESMQTSLVEELPQTPDEALQQK